MISSVPTLIAPNNFPSQVEGMRSSVTMPLVWFGMFATNDFLVSLKWEAALQTDQRGLALRNSVVRTPMREPAYAL